MFLSKKSHYDNLIKSIESKVDEKYRDYFRSQIEIVLLDCYSEGYVDGTDQVKNDIYYGLYD